MRNRLIVAHIALCAAVLLAAPLSAQFIGYTTPQTVQRTALDAVTTAPTNSANMPNIGQNVHKLSYSTGGTGTVRDLNIVIQASIDNVSFFDISENATNTFSGNITATDYYPFVRIRLTRFETNSGTPTLTATYVGSSVTPVIQGTLAISSYLKEIWTGLPSNTTTVQSVNIPAGNTSGTLYAKFSDAACASATLSIGVSGPFSSALDFTMATFTLVAQSAAQAFTVPLFSSQRVTITYTAGGACVAGTTLSVSYYTYNRPVQSAVKSIQSGTITFDASVTISAIATITSVATAKAKVELNGFTLNGCGVMTADQLASNFPMVVLTNSTTVTASIGNVLAAHCSSTSVRFTVIEFT